MFVSSFLSIDCRCVFVIVNFMYMVMMVMRLLFVVICSIFRYLVWLCEM